MVVSVYQEQDARSSLGRIYDEISSLSTEIMDDFLMTMNTVSRLLFAVLVAGTIGAWGTTTNAIAGLGGTKILDQTGCQRCPECKHRCHFEAEQVDVEKSCFEVEKKVICIPRVVFPWQTAKQNCGSCDSCDGRGCSTCVNHGGRTREINVLKSKKYKCPQCKYTWSAEEKPCGGCAGGCDSGCAGIPVGAYEVVTPNPSSHAPAYSEPIGYGLESTQVLSQPLPVPVAK